MPLTYRQAFSNGFRTAVSQVGSSFLTPGGTGPAEVMGLFNAGFAGTPSSPVYKRKRESFIAKRNVRRRLFWTPRMKTKGAARRYYSRRKYVRNKYSRRY